MGNKEANSLKRMAVEKHDQDIKQNEQEVIRGIHDVIKAEELRATELLRLPPVERKRPTRNRLFTGETITRNVLWVLSCVCVAVYIAVATWAYAQVDVPELVGMPEEQALLLLTELGLQGDVTGKRSSDEPSGEVIEQDPASRQRLEQGDVVEIVLSSGPDGFEIPDVIGEEQSVARFELERLGLEVVIEQFQADAPAGTVAFMTPIAGTRIYDTDIEEQSWITLYVVTPIASAGLIAYELEGLRVAIEPHYTTTLAGDVTFDVSRRLSSLFEAADAEVRILRRSNERRVEQSEYDVRAMQFGPDLHIIIRIQNENPTGLIVRSAEAEEDSIARMIYERMKENQLEVTLVRRSEAFGQAGERNSIEIVLGNAANLDDLENFQRGFWRDHVARAIYMASAPRFSLSP